MISDKLSIGVRVPCLGLPLRQALAAAQRLGVAGVELDAVGDLAPARLSQTGRHDIRHLLQAHDLALTALGCPLRHGLDAAENQEARIDHVRNVLTLSRELGPGIVIVQAGRVQQPEDDLRAARLRESLAALGRHGDRVGSILALETGLEDGATLQQYLAGFDSGSLGVNFDPANLLMHGFNPNESLRALAGKVVHAHAKDARTTGASRIAQEVALGHGDIDWLSLAGIFAEIGYRGWLTIEREGGEHKLQDMAAGVAFLRRFV